MRSGSLAKASRMGVGDGAAGAGAGVVVVVDVEEAEEEPAVVLLVDGLVEAAEEGPAEDSGSGGYAPAEKTRFGGARSVQVMRLMAEQHEQAGFSAAVKRLRGLPSASAASTRASSCLYRSSISMTGAHSSRHDVSTDSVLSSFSRCRKREPWVLR